MYAVSEAYLEKIRSDNVVTRWYGTIRAKNGVTYEITPSRVVDRSLKITRQICQNDKDLQIGTTCAAELDLSLYLDNVNRYELYEATVTLSFFLELEADVWEEVPVGIFTVDEPPERNVSVITLHAYDNMLKFNKDFGATLQGQPYSIITRACDVCGVELGNTQEEISNMVNGTVETYNFSEVQIYTWRDVIGHMASFLCCVSRIGADGKLYFVPYGLTADRTITENERYEYKPKDYEAYYSSLEAYFAVTQEYETVILYDGGLKYDLGTNPFIQFNADDVRLACLTNIISRLSQVSYTPFSGKFWCDPSIEPGDVLNFTGNHAIDGKLAAVTKQVIKMNGQMELSCGGSDPNLNVLTAVEKRIQTAAKNSNKDGMYYYDYENASRIKIRDGKTARIIVFNYTTTKQTHVDFHAEARCWIDTTEDYDEPNDIYTENDGVLYVSYRQGGDLVTQYYPVDTFFDGDHLLHLFYAWWASGNIVSSFEVYLSAVGCDVTIEAGAVRGTIEGVGLVGEVNWDGGVYIYDDFVPYDFGRIRKQLTDEVDAQLPTESGDTAITRTPKINFFRKMLKGFREAITGKGLHRFSVPYNDGEVEKTNVTANGNVWQNIDTSVDGTVTTYDCRVERILKVTSARTPGSGDVTYLCSFNSGETWYTYADGWVPYEGDYGMVEGTLESITEDEWASMIAENGTIMIQATLTRNATLTDIQIYTYETNNWVSQGPEAAYGFDSRYVTNSTGQVELITKGYRYTGSAQSVDSGREQRLLIDTSIFSDVRGVYVHDALDGILSEDQKNLNNWVASATGWQRDIVFDEGINTMSMLAAGGWESLTTEVEVEPHRNYRLTFRYNTPTGYSPYNNEGRRCFVWSQDWIWSNNSPSLTDSRLLGYSGVWGTGASNTTTVYTVNFNSGNNYKVKIELSFGDVTDNSRATFVFRELKLVEV